jgi:hypothetical protein
MQHKVITATFLVLSTLVACSPVPIRLNHSPSMASEQAQRFAELAFVERDFGKAYELLSESGKSRGSAEQFGEFVVKKHPSVFPLFVNATDYEPIPGQNKMGIYLYGENGSDTFYYQMIMVGVQETGYKVAGFDRANAPYPQSNLRQSFGPR